MTAMGKRYVCVACEGEVLCTKPGDGTPSRCGAEMVLREAKPLPSSD